MAATIVNATIAANPNMRTEIACEAPRSRSALLRCDGEARD